MPAKRGRPRKPEEVRELIIQMAKDTGWGYRRILGELKKLRIRVSQATVARILKENGFDLGLKRGEGTWHDFVQRHIKTLWACDFFTKKVWTTRGLMEYYVLFFIHIGTRRVHVVGMTPNPDGLWMAQQARSMSIFFAEQDEHRPTHIICDRDSKYTAQFRSILESDGIAFRPIPPRSPNTNSHAETWVQRIERGCLDHFVFCGEQHLRLIISSWLEYYHRFRHHQGAGNVPLSMTNSAPDQGGDAPVGEVVYRQWLGGLLKHFEREAA